ncbi:hypothetical protein F5Y16DRAFT_361616 [Xylariaceae sp. FL0255]|nr:hypothetical protein F5Y16DRAFT_361616 [Xylariaceae sp. FL0255]
MQSNMQGQENWTAMQCRRKMCRQPARENGLCETHYRAHIKLNKAYQTCKLEESCPICGGAVDVKEGGGKYVHCRQCRFNVARKQKDRRDARKLAGKCIECGQPAAENGLGGKHIRCTDCRARTLHTLAPEQAVSEKTDLKGGPEVIRLCSKSNCPQPVHATSRTVCEYHFLLQKKSYQRKYATRKAAGVCTRCGVRPVVKGKTHCAQCRANMQAMNKVYWQRTREQARKQFSKKAIEIVDLTGDSDTEIVHRRPWEL